MVMFLRVLNVLAYTLILAGVGLALMLISGCGSMSKEPDIKSERTPAVAPTEEEPTSCTVTQLEGGALITCPDGSTAEVYHGQDGIAGPAGRDGTSCTVTEFEGGADINCDDGSSVLVFQGKDGEQGEQGEKGDKGNKGKKGEVVYSKPVYVGYFCSRVVLEIGQEIYVLHSQLIPITEEGVKISNTCGVKLEEAEVVTYEP